MKRVLLISFLVPLGLAAVVHLAQAQMDARAGQAGSDSSQGPAAQVQLTGGSVADMAQFVAGVVADSGTVPDWMQARTTSGRLQRLSATDAFIALAQALAFWDSNGRLPDRVAITPGSVTPPVLATEDLPEAEREEAPDRQISTDLFISQAQQALRGIDQFHLIPTGVSVDGIRLSTAQYLAGMAIAVDYAARNGRMDTPLYVPDVAAPPMWVARTRLIAEHVPYPTSAEGDSDDDTAAPASPPSPARAQENSVPAKPALDISPASGTITGAVDVFASYAGPTAQFVLFQVDGQTKAISNTPPYTYRLDTARLAPGAHKLVIRVLGDGDAEIIRSGVTYLVAPPPAPVAPKTEATRPPQSPAPGKPAQPAPPAPKPPAPEKAAAPAPKKS